MPQPATTLVLSVSFGPTSVYNGFAVNDHGEGTSKAQLVRDIFAPLSDDGNTRESVAILPTGILGSERKDAINNLFCNEKCCKGMGTGYLDIAKFTELGAHLIAAPTKRSLEEVRRFAGFYPSLTCAVASPIPLRTHK